MKLRQILRILLTLLALSFFALACTLTSGGERKLPDGAYNVDPLFKLEYENLGGFAILGPAISPIFENNGLFYQYTVSSLLSFDPNAADGQGFGLAPLGRDMGIFEFPNQAFASTRQREVGGYLIYEKFVSIFDQLGGENVVGRPLTEVHRNAEKGRYEQYFENLGFYWVDGDDPEAVYLLAYGAWKCDRYCRLAPPQNAAVLLPARSNELFVRTVANLGLDFTGFALTPPYVAADGRLEQVFENVVMITAPGEETESAHLLPLPEKIGIQRDVLMPPDRQPGVYFYPVQGGTGYNVPNYFMAYIKNHGGFDLVGPPITQLIQMDDELYRQCFANLCLQRQPDENDVPVIRPVPIGLKYRSLYYKPEGTGLENVTSTDVTVQIWEGYPMVSPNQEQEIGVVVFSGSTPLENVLPVLNITLPDGSVKEYSLPSTDKNGESHIQIPAMGAENGTIIPYKVCVSPPNGQRFCVLDSYLIWKADFITVSPTIEPKFSAYLPFLFQHLDVYIPAVVESYRTYLPILNLDK
jgi:hypothetical protein